MKVFVNWEGRTVGIGNENGDNEHEVAPTKEEVLESIAGRYPSARTADCVVQHGEDSVTFVFTERLATKGV